MIPQSNSVVDKIDHLIEVAQSEHGTHADRRDAIKELRDYIENAKAFAFALSILNDEDAHWSAKVAAVYATFPRVEEPEVLLAFEACLLNGTISLPKDALELIDKATSNPEVKKAIAKQLPFLRIKL